MRSLLVVVAILSPTFASGFPPLLPRQTSIPIPCSQQPGMTACGTDYDCCPSTEYCTLGSNGEYACCPNGEYCTGPGGTSSAVIGTQTVPWTTSQPTVPPASSSAIPSPIPCSQQSGMKTCGGSFQCIPESDTCCPDGSGSCPSGEYCSLGSNGKYGCCPNGEYCTGPGGVSSGLGFNPSSTSFVGTPSPSTSSSPLPNGGAATSQLVFNEVTIFGSLLIGLLPRLLG